MKVKSTPTKGMKVMVKGEFLHLRSCVINLNICLCCIIIIKTLSLSFYQTFWTQFFMVLLFSWAKMFLDQTSFDKNFIGPKKIWNSKFFKVQIFSDTKFFCHPQIFWAQNLFGPTNFWTYSYSGLKSFQIQKPAQRRRGSSPATPHRLQCRNAPPPAKSKMASRGPQKMANGVPKGVYPYVFGHSKHLLLNKFFDPSTPSRRKRSRRRRNGKKNGKTGGKKD